MRPRTIRGAIAGNINESRQPGKTGTNQFMTTPTEDKHEIVMAEPPHSTIVTISTGASIEEMVRRRELIAELMKRVLKVGEHYGPIPGAGDKNVLLQPGAQKIGGMFNLGSKIVKEEIVELENGHREYRLVVGVFHYPTGMEIAQAPGSCSTMESKYRYRNVADYEVTEDRIPQDYKEKKHEYRKKGFGAKKHEGQWVWVKYGDESRTDNPDIADVWNTVYKMAFKRAYVNAILQATTASDFFTQDLEEGGNGGHRGSEPSGTTEKPVAGRTAPKKAHPEAPVPEVPEVWEAQILDVDEEEKGGKMVYHVKFVGGREAGTLNEELARKAYEMFKTDPLSAVRASVRPGRYPNTFELREVEAP